jgi:hypothetical protein
LWLRGKAKWSVVAAETLDRDLIEKQRLEEGESGRKAPIIYKMHGNLDRDDRAYDWFLITEEHYVDFLGRPETGQVPPTLAALMKKRNFLFLGYGLKDWNVRVMLRKLALMRGPASKIDSWAIVKEASVSEKELWAAQNIQMFEMDLDDFAARLGEELENQRKLKASKSAP